MAPALSPVDLDDSYEEQSRLEDYDQAAPTVHQAVRNVLKTAGIDYSAIPGPTVPPWLLQLHHGIHAAMVDSGRRHLNRSDSAAGLPLNPAFSGITGQTALQPVANLAFTDLVRRYEGDRARAPLSPKAAEKRQAQLKFLTEIIGARTPVRSVDRETARRVFDAVGRMPANAGKRFPRKSVADLLALPPEKIGARLSTVTANGYMTLFGSVMEFAVAEHIIDRNPAKNLRFAHDGVADRDRRLPLTVADLGRLFGAPLYTGCIDDGSNYAKPGPARPRRGRFWVPLISLFTGLRLTEVLQLTEDDIQRIDGVDVISVRANADEKRLKTASATRIVPIHRELKCAGFMALVANARKSPGSRLFPDQTVSAQGDLGSKFSKWFAHMLDSVGVSDRRKAFHSLRHSFRDALREAGVSTEVSRALGGWSGGPATTDQIYGSGFSAKALAEAIEQLRFSGLDLRHLEI